MRKMIGVPRQILGMRNGEAPSAKLYRYRPPCGRGLAPDCAAGPERTRCPACGRAWFRISRSKRSDTSLRNGPAEDAMACRSTLDRPSPRTSDATRGVGAPRPVDG